MHTESRFSDVTVSLRNGFLADSVILAIAKVSRSGEVSNLDKKVFADAAVILEGAIKGNALLDDPQVTATATSYANFFAQAVSALPEVHTREDVVENLGTLKDTAVQLAEGNKIPTPERLKQLRMFFLNTAEEQLERTEKLLEGESAAEAFKWIGLDK